MLGKQTQRILSSLRRRADLVFVLPLLLAASCMVGPDYTTPKAKVAAEWSGAQTNASPPVKAPDAFWWKSFNDPVLDALILAAYTNNLSLQSAGARILQARAQFNQSIGNLFPQQQGLSAGINYTKLNTSGLSFVPSGITSDFLQDQLMFSASWEIDLWGKYRRTIQSDRAAYIGTIASYDDALVTLISDVASSYINIRTTEERLRVAARNLEAQRESYRVAQVQYQFGETSELDVRQSKSLLAQTEAQVPRLQDSLTQSKNGLALLLGETPDKVDQYLQGQSRIPTAPDPTVVGIPRDLLRRRPDVRAAGETAASQCALIGVAKANMYPALSLTGMLGLSSNNELNNSLANMFSWQGKAAQAGASIVWPIFNYGRLVNQVRVQDAQFQQAVLNYQNTVLNAQQEVENGFSAFYTEKRALTNLVDAASAARRATELSMIRYKSGETDYTTVLSTEQAQLSAEDAEASSRGQVVLGLVSIYRALGGGWEIREGHDVLSEEVKAEMRRRTNWGGMLEAEHHLPKTQPEGN